MAHPTPPDTITISGTHAEEGNLNGRYALNGRFKASGKWQWMRPGSRCYIRYIRERWEIYISHHPHGSTYFCSSAHGEIPPVDGWKPTQLCSPDEAPHLTLHYDATSSDEAKTPAPLPPHSNVDARSDEAASGTTLELYTNATCPFAQRVRIVASELAVAPRETNVDVFGDKGAAFESLFKEACPGTTRRAAIPLLRDSISGAVLIESKIICGYLADREIEAGADLAARARALARGPLRVPPVEAPGDPDGPARVRREAHRAVCHRRGAARGGVSGALRR